jgi:hypothetical protein
MIKTCIASAEALCTFGLAAVGGTVVGVAAPANAAPNQGSGNVGTAETTPNKPAPTVGLPDNGYKPLAPPAYIPFNSGNVNTGFSNSKPAPAPGTTNNPADRTGKVGSPLAPVRTGMLKNTAGSTSHDDPARRAARRVGG